MNLREFLGYREHCFACGEKLSTLFMNRKKQKHRLDGDKFLTIFDMKSLNKLQKSYKVGYCVGMEDNSLCIEFYDQKGNVEFNDSVPRKIIDKFKKFHKNVLNPRISRCCFDCDRYYYESSDLNFDFKTSKLDEFEMRDEWVRFSLPADNKYKNYEIWNQYNIQTSNVRSYKSNLENGADYNRRLEPAQMPILQFNSILELSKRIDTIMPFI